MASGVGSATRIAVAVLIAIFLALFMLAWDGELIPYRIAGIAYWLGPVIFLPLLAVLVVFAGDCLIQQLSCGEVKWLIQLQRAAVAPIPFWFTSFLLYMIPSLRWPIEGLIQHTSPLIRNGVSSGFYTFWTGLYVQSLLISLSQLC